MIVNKPQFDVDKIKPGQAYWLQKVASNGYYEINTPCIVQKAKPLELLVTYYKEPKGFYDEGHMKNIFIKIEEVVTTRRDKIILIPLEKVVVE